MATTTNSGLTISATADGARYSGRNEQIAMNVAPSRPHCGPVGSVDQRLPSSRAAQDRVLRVVGYDDRVIDQHSHRDDESGQRSTVQADAEKLHDQQRAADGEDQRTADQYAGAQTHDQHDQYDYDRNRFDQVDDEGIVGFPSDLVFRIERL